MTSGILNVLKPCGMTSHDVVGFLRRTLQTKKIGHGGTLDPDAAGVLPVFVGSATRLLEYAVEGRKNYRAELRFGSKTDTGDDSGKIIATSEIRSLTPTEIKDALQKFIGEQQQIPPMYSAIKIDGKKLYQLARQGIEVERQARTITVYALELLHHTEHRFDGGRGLLKRHLYQDFAGGYSCRAWYVRYNELFTAQASW